MKNINNTRNPMYIKSMVVLFFLVLIGCNNDNTSLTNSNSVPDSIVSYRIITDTMLTDVNYPFKDYPRVTKTGDSLIQVEHLVQNDCGEADFGVSKDRDTFIVSAIFPDPLAIAVICNDWSPELYYKATIRYVGKCNYVKFTKSQRFIGYGYGDTLVHL